MADGAVQTRKEAMRGPSCVVQTCDYQGKAAVAKASRPSAAKATKSTGLRSSSLIQPLSSYSDDIKRAAAKRTEERVTRPADVRRKETEKQDGYVKRPLNSFMLYRSAYITVAKEHYPRSKQNDLSVIVATSWHKEDQELHELYEVYANIERCNHHAAYPEYKFSPKKLNIQKGGTNQEEEARPISENTCRYQLAAGPVHSCALVPSPASGELTAWQPIFLPMQPAGWYGGHGKHTNYCQIAGNRVPWPSAMAPPGFRVHYGPTWEPTMGSMAFPTMPTLNRLPIADPCWKAAEMPASVNYAMPLHDPSCCIYCGYPCTLSEAGALL
jgi:hypothetical protein